MNKTIRIFFAILILSSISAAQEAKLTLKESIETGFKNSKELIISRSKIIGSEAKIDEINSQFLPQLKFSANYTRLSDVPPFKISVPFSPQPITVSEVILNNYSFRVTAQQQVFTGFRLESLRNSARYNKDAFVEELNREKNELAMNIHTAFWNYNRAKLYVKLTGEFLQQIEKHAEDTRNFVSQGLATRNDLLKLLVQQSNIKLQQIEANNNLNITRIAFNKSLGIPLDRATEIEEEEIQLIEQKQDINDLITEAKNNRSELKSIDLRVKAGTENVDAVNSTWYPSVFLTGNYNFSRPNQRYQPPLDEFKGTWDLGITLSWDIWNWGNTSSQTAQVEQIVIQSQTSREQIKDAIELEVSQNYLTLMYSIERAGVTKTAIEQAEENYRTTLEKYNVQLAPSSELVDAETSLLQAKTNYINALIDYQLSKIKLNKSLGRAIY
jgi:outer membrane protein TolC